ncbi:hypothetical protein QWY93_03160 [Echinicola jeungdonensis]|uniref:Outer membrane protein beta-barrel domain-containing protein n=1 Tax=Echinicola jeungdonensis TaxID=709343 RepID=A0ABV5J2F6_9BACT|nr:hypothetical protein [Echinicola jeungdonensis]MDN3668327.1 hypothetical protein [Echinicola jeungdonensis]
MWWWKNKNIITKIFLLFFTLGLISYQGFSQRAYFPEEGVKTPLNERLYFGGNFGLQFGSITYIEASPLVGLMMTERYSVGLGATYRYLNYKDIPNAKSSIYGGKVFNRYNLLDNLFAHAELETLNVELVREDPPGEFVFYREWVPGLFLGGGYFMPFGNRGGLNFSILYNVLYDNQKSPYNEPYVIRAGFVF